jgi:hypothetical protein
MIAKCRISSVVYARVLGVEIDERDLNGGVVSGEFDLRTERGPGR